MNKACESGSRESIAKFDKHTFSGRKLTYFMQTTPIFCVSCRCCGLEWIIVLQKLFLSCMGERVELLSCATRVN